MKKGLTCALLLVLLLPFTFGEGSKEKEKPLATVRYAIHANEGGATLAGVAVEQGLFKKYGINAVVTVVEGGPAEMAAMRSDNASLDIGYIGSGIAWSPLDTTGNSVSTVFLDGLSNSEVLIAKSGLFTDTNKNGKYENEEIYAGLKGKTVFMDVTTTPGTWFKNLLQVVNGKLPADQQLWISCEVSSYLLGYQPANTKPENKVNVVNTLNSNLASGIAATGSDRMDIVVAYAPVTNIILKTIPGTVRVATTADNLPPEMQFPSTWVANTKWLQNNPEVAQNFINALYEAAEYRAKNIDASMRAGEKLSQRPANSFSPSDVVVISKDMYQAWFATPDSQGYGYLRALYNNKKGSVPAGSTPKPFEKAFDDSFLLQAIKTIK